MIIYVVHSVVMPMLWAFIMKIEKRKVILMANELVSTGLTKQYQIVLDDPSYQLDNGRTVTVTPRVATMFVEQGVRLSHQTPLDSHRLTQAVVAGVLDHWDDKQ